MSLPALIGLGVIIGMAVLLAVWLIVEASVWLIRKCGG